MEPATPNRPTLPGAEATLSAAPSSSARLFYCPACDRAHPAGGAEPLVPSCPACRGPLRPLALGAPLGPVLPSPAPRADGTPFGRYLLLRELGHGGMGVVYEAHDPQLGRSVALKMLLSPAGNLDAQAAERLLREARAAARFRHPSIVAIHDVGEAEGRPYFTMDLVDGRSFEECLAEPESTTRFPVRRRVEILAEVAEALGYAHALGVLHRDVKPSNVLVDRAGRGMLMDFGLAKEIASTELREITATGAFLGTPGYVSPEVLGGGAKAVGPPGDVFAFGVLFYRALTGAMPFEGEAMQSAMAVLLREPARPSRVNPRVHADLETICLRCLEKDPARRFPDGTALAAELRRWLAGEPILSRPVPWWERAWRRGAKHRGAAAAVFLLVLVIGLVAWTWAEDHARKARVRMAEGRAQEAESARLAAEETLHKAQLVSAVFGRWARLATPLAELEATHHDDRLAPGEKRTRGAERWRAVQGFLDETPADPASRATGLALAAWARRWAGFPDEAEAWLTDATAIDPDVPYGPLVQALALLSLYAEEQQLPPVTSSATGLTFGAPAGEAPALADVRARMLTLLEEAGKRRVWGREGGEANRAAIEGILATQRGDLAAAEEALGRALQAPDLRAARVSLLLARARVRYLRKEFARALEDLEEAKRARPGQAEIWKSAGMTRTGAAVEAQSRRDDSRPELRAALAEFARAVELAPRDGQILINRSGAWIHLGEAQRERGEDPRESYAAAIADLGGALERAPGRADAWRNRAMAEQALGQAQEARGEDPREAFRAAEADFTRTLEREPDDAELFAYRGTLRIYLGDAQAAWGEDPRVAYRGAVADLDETVRRQPGDASALNDRGYARLGLGEARAAQGEDACDDFRAAIADFTRCLEREPDDAKVGTNRANARYALGQALAARGEDPQAEFASVVAEYDRMLARDPLRADGWHNRGNARAALATAVSASGGDARAGFEAAIADFEMALELDPAHDTAHYNRGGACLSLAQLLAAGGGDARAPYEAAAADFEVALARRPDLWQAAANRGAALEALGRPEEAVPCYEAALRVVGDAVPALRQSLARARAAARAADERK